VLTEDHCWADYRIGPSIARGRPCLFLDRDGVVIEDIGYPGRAEDANLIPQTLETIRVANDRGFVVGLVTNQSGIARGLFGWDGFEAVQSVIDEALNAHGAHLDFVLACPHHSKAEAEIYRNADHGWRKPSSGMLRAVRDRLDIDLASSIIVGDRESDMAAGLDAGLRHRILLLAAEDAPRLLARSATAVLPRADLRTYLLDLAPQPLAD
jgi:D-glycero-D-manno-heptose 1,7-bisphosphate phosphatase